MAMNFEDVEVLIAEVEKRPSLWNHRSKAYHNRGIVDNDWNEVAEKTQMPREIAKSRWKNLRDQFRKVLKKVLNNGLPTTSATPKWIYFEKLMFLQNILESPVRPDLSLQVDTNVDTNTSGDYEDQDTQFSTDSAPCSPPDIKPVISRSAKKSGVKRKCTEPTPYDKQFLESDNPSLVLVKDNQFNEDDDDLNFFKSLIPFMRQLPSLRKLVVRSEMQEILVRELTELERYAPEEASY